METLTSPNASSSQDERATRAAVETLVASTLVAVATSIILVAYWSGPWSTALVVAGQLAVLLAVTYGVLRWRLAEAGVTAEAIPARALLAAAAWLAPLATLSLRSSYWCVPAAIVFALLAVLMFRALTSQSELPPARSGRDLFQMSSVSEEQSARSTSAKAGSYLAYFGVVLGLTVSVPLAALFVGAACGLVAWHAFSPNRTRPARWKTSASLALIALIVASQPPRPAVFGSDAPSGYEEQAEALNSGDRSGLHAGIVLFTEIPSELEFDMPPLPQLPTLGYVTPTEPLSIPFDGEYWIYYRPLRGPGPAASRKRGSPVTAAYRSIDDAIFVMEARQTLSKAIRFGDYRALDVAFKSIDSQPDKIAMEILLGNSSETEWHLQSLGAQALAAETAGTWSLQFDTAEGGDREYKEIVVRFHLYPPRQHRSARIAIERFDLAP